MTPYEQWQKDNYEEILPNYDNPFMMNEDEEKEEEQRKFERDEEIYLETLI